MTESHRHWFATEDSVCSELRWADVERADETHGTCACRHAYIRHAWGGFCVEAAVGAYISAPS